MVAKILRISFLLSPIAVVLFHYRKKVTGEIIVLRATVMAATMGIVSIKSIFLTVFF